LPVNILINLCNIEVYFIGMKNLLLPFICCLWLTGQAQQHKLDAQLKLWVKHPQSLLINHPALYKKDATADVMVSILFKTTSNNPLALVKKHQGQLHSILGTICTAELPLNQIEAFANQPEIIKIESAQPVHVTNQKGMELMRADSVKNGLLPEQVQYSGKDVIVGIVDTGIDFLNADFRKKKRLNPNTHYCLVGPNGIKWHTTKQL
jgi:hypothetical protein